MNWLSTAVFGFRSEDRRCFSISGSLLLLLCLLVAHAACRPSDDAVESFDLGEEYADVDNVEWHHVKVVNGVLREDHPIIMYKEDFVSEDYKPSKNRTTSDKAAEDIATVPRSNRTRKYQTHRRHHRPNLTESTEHYRTLKPEKIYFDVLPEKPVVVADDSEADDSKFDAANIRVEVISLLDDKDTVTQIAEQDKEVLSKRPKKYRRRMRRDTVAHNVHKRNPYFQQLQDTNLNSLTDFLKTFYGAMHATTPPTRQSHPVQGKLWNSLNLPVEVPADPPIDEALLSFTNRFGGPDNEDRVVWTSRPSRVGQNNMGATGTRPRTTSRPPSAERPPSSIFHNSDPNNADFSFLTRPNRRITTTTPSPFVNSGSVAGRVEAAAAAPEISANDALVSQCVWAIVNCCSSRDSEIRYHCFEQLGCSGSFWGLNPCADNIRDSVINFVGDAND